jgi:hypothetical protein
MESQPRPFLYDADEPMIFNSAVFLAWSPAQCLTTSLIIDHIELFGSKQWFYDPPGVKPADGIKSTWTQMPGMEVWLLLFDGTPNLLIEFLSEYPYPIIEQLGAGSGWCSGSGCWHMSLV